jgi:hypothetical protein
MDKDTAQEHFDRYTEWLWDKRLEATDERWMSSLSNVELRFSKFELPCLSSS